MISLAQAAVVSTLPPAINHDNLNMAETRDIPYHVSDIDREEIVARACDPRGKGVKDQH